MRPVGSICALLLVGTSLCAQQAATGGTGPVTPKPRPLVLPKAPSGATGGTGSLSMAEKLAIARGATGSTGVAKAATGSTGAVQHAAPKATTGSAGSTGGTKVLAAKPAGAAKGSTGSVKPPVAKPAGAAAATGGVKPVAKAVVPAAKVPAAAAKVPAAAAKVPVAAAKVPVAAAPAGPVPGVMNRTVIVLDPAHGGGDSGSRLSEKLVEKDVTLQFGFKLRSLLQARGFTVVMTRDADLPANAPAPLSLDDRAGVMNHQRAVACLLLHATASGAGVHVYHSDLEPAAGEAASLPWLTAQAAWVAQSTALAGKLAQSFTRASVPLVSSAASIRPVDSLTCPALVVELAPKGGDVSSLDDSSYQQSVAEALAGALVFWKNQAVAPNKLAETDAGVAR